MLTSPSMLIIALAFLLCVLNGCTAVGSPFRNDIKFTSGKIAIVGDTQRTLAVERLVGREQNDAERPRIIAAIAAERPDLVVHLGDAVAFGASAADWKRFDELLSPIRAANIPVFPVLGNHDYWGLRSIAMTNFCSRFPAADAHWYSQRYGRLALIWLDSNHANLSSEEWERQSHWLKDQLAQADADPSIRAALLFCHHPPFTNSTVTTDDPDVKKTFVPLFNASRKAVAMFCGHTHAYEHFRQDGKTHIVSGGGGGPRPQLLIGDKQRHTDLFTGPSPRPFHYLVLLPTERGLEVDVKGFDKGEKTIRSIDHFMIAYGE